MPFWIWAGVSILWLDSRIMTKSQTQFSILAMRLMSTLLEESLNFDSLMVLMRALVRSAWFELRLRLREAPVLAGVRYFLTIFMESRTGSGCYCWLLPTLSLNRAWMLTPTLSRQLSRSIFASALLSYYLQEVASVRMRLWVPSSCTREDAQEQLTLTGDLASHSVTDYLMMSHRSSWESACRKVIRYVINWVTEDSSLSILVSLRACRTWAPCNSDLSTRSMQLRRLTFSVLQSSVNSLMNPLAMPNTCSTRQCRFSTQICCPIWLICRRPRFHCLSMQEQMTELSLSCSLNPKIAQIFPSFYTKLYPTTLLRPPRTPYLLFSFLTVPFLHSNVSTLFKYSQSDCNYGCLCLSQVPSSLRFFA